MSRISEQLIQPLQREPMINQVHSGQLSKQLIQDLDYSIPLNKGYVSALNSEILLSKSNSSKLSVNCFLSVQN